MLARLKWRGAVASFFAAAAVAMLLTPAKAQAPSGQPVTIGFSMALTGPLAANGKQALLGMKIWEEEINAKGGLLGRPVKLVYYDDQSNPSTVPGIYTKLLDVDRVALVLGPYATAMAAPAMPVIMQKGKVFIILFGLDVNHEFKYPKFFAMIPTGPDTKPSFTTGFFEVAAAQNPKPQTVALAAADQEFSDRKSTRLNSSHSQISYAVFCLKKKNAAHREGQSCDIATFSASTESGRVSDVRPSMVPTDPIPSTIIPRLPLTRLVPPCSLRS